MALFKKDSDTKKEVVVKEDLSWVIIKPRITEKAAMVSSDNAYVFDVATRANKVQIKRAIIAQYKVAPLKVNVISQKPRKVMRRGRKVHQKGTKKAVVFLKKGDTIELA
jgi:large subunit ribosomal protein L23